MWISLYLSLISYLFILFKKNELYWISQWQCIAKPAKYPPNTMIKFYATNEEFLAIIKKEYLIIFKISARILMLIDEINNVAEWFRVKSPSLARWKEGDLPLWTFATWHVCWY